LIYLKKIFPLNWSSEIGKESEHYTGYLLLDYEFNLPCSYNSLPGVRSFLSLEISPERLIRVDKYF
jgi:hypothetical protein